MPNFACMNQRYFGEFVYHYMQDVLQELGL